MCPMCHDENPTPNMLFCPKCVATTSQVMKVVYEARVSRMKKADKIANRKYTQAQRNRKAKAKIEARLNLD